MFWDFEKFSRHKLFMFVVKCHRMPEMAVWHFFCFIGEEPDLKRMNGENEIFLCSSFFIAVYPEENVSAGFCVCVWPATISFGCLWINILKKGGRNNE